MKAEAQVVASRRRDGSTQLSKLAGCGPITLRPTGLAPGARVHLVAGTFGPLGGDDLTLRITVEPGAELHVAAAAATLVLPSRDAQPSSLRIQIVIAESARLRLTMPPTVLCAGARHRIDTQVMIAATGELLLREEIVRGRTGEHGGDVTVHTTLDVDRTSALRQTIQLDGPVDNVWHPRAVGGLLYVSPEQKPVAVEGPFAKGLRAAWLRLAGDAGHQLTALADDPLALSQLLDATLRQLPR